MYFISIKNTYLKKILITDDLSNFCWLVVMVRNNRSSSSYLLILSFIRWEMNLTSRLVEYRLRDIKDTHLSVNFNDKQFECKRHLTHFSWWSSHILITLSWSIFKSIIYFIYTFTKRNRERPLVIIHFIYIRIWFQRY